MIARAAGASALAGLGLLALVSACVRDLRNVERASTTAPKAPSPLEPRSWGLCSLVGPGTGSAGVYGTDLGFTVRRRDADGDRLAILFGDTLAKPTEGCKYPVFQSDDLQGYLPLTRPAVLTAGAPSKSARAACDSFGYRLTERSDPTSWERIRLYANASGNDDALMNTGVLRAPVTAFSDGQRAFVVFVRNEAADCKRTSECPAGMACSADPAYRGKKPGVCAEPPVSPAGELPPAFCRDGKDCGPLSACKEPEHGYCMASRPYATRVADEVVTPAWYENDARLGIAKVVHIASAIWPERPADYLVVQRFVTNRFLNVTARTVAHFDPDHPERNDYRPGHHTLLMWGRPAFAGAGGFQSLPFFLYAPLAELRGERARFLPRFFAGYAADGRVRWSDRESDAQPIYGTDAQLTPVAPPPGASSDQKPRPRMRFEEPEFDYVNHVSVSFVAPLARWVMFYGGDAPAFMVMGPDGKAHDPVHPARAPGGIHMRTARHPWGRARRDAPDAERWSSPRPVLTRQQAAPFLACGDADDTTLRGCIEDPDPGGPFAVFGSLVKLARRSSVGEFFKGAGSCLGGEVFTKGAELLEEDRMGRLYGVNIIEEWTEDVTEHVSGASSSERAVELYWNASTWNPYQVVLFKTQISERDGHPAH